MNSTCLINLCTQLSPRVFLLVAMSFAPPTTNKVRVVQKYLSLEICFLQIIFPFYCVYKAQRNKIRVNRMKFGSPKFWLKICWPLLKAKLFPSQIQGLLYSKEPALQHRCNEAIDKLIRGRVAEISSEKCQKFKAIIPTF